MCTVGQRVLLTITGPGPSFSYFAITDPECDRRFRRHGRDVRHASMPTPDEIRKATLHIQHTSMDSIWQDGCPACQHAGAGCDSEGLAGTSGMPASNKIYMTRLTSSINFEKKKFEKSFYLKFVFSIFFIFKSSFFFKVFYSKFFSKILISQPKPLVF